MAGSDLAGQIVVLLQAKGDGAWVATLEIAKGVNKTTKSDVNPALYALEGQNVIERDPVNAKPRWRLRTRAAASGASQTSEVAVRPEPPRGAAAAAAAPATVAAAAAAAEDDAGDRGGAGKERLAAATAQTDGEEPQKPERDWKSDLNKLEPNLQYDTTMLPNKCFKATVPIQGQVIAGRCIGKNKKDAEQFAAKEALEHLRSLKTSPAQHRQEASPEVVNARDELPEHLQEERRLAFDLQLREHDRLLKILQQEGVPVGKGEMHGLSACIQLAKSKEIISPEEVNRLQEINTRGNCAKHNPERLQPILTSAASDSTSAPEGPATTSARLESQSTSSVAAVSESDGDCYNIHVKVPKGQGARNITMKLSIAESGC